MLDSIIIGSGPAGLTAAVYLRRAEKKVLVLEKETFGGQITCSPKVENCPGFSPMSGNEIAEHFMEQAMSLGAELDLDNIVSVKKTDDGFLLQGENSTYESKTVLIASGSKHRKLGVPGEDERIGSQISFCAVCDGAFYKDKDVILVGGGNSALQEAVLLSEICHHVTLIQNLHFLTGEQALQDILQKKSNIDFIFSTVVTAFEGDENSVTALLRDHNSNDSKLTADGVFIAIGQQPENEPFGELCDLDNQGYIMADENCLTKTDGVFVAGDCRTKKVRQVATASGDGATAAVAICKYLDN